VWDRNYDRIFGAKSAGEAAKAIRDLPKNIAKDIVDVSPTELASTTLAAGTLAAIRGGIHKMPVKDNGFTRDWAANALGYAVFFDLNGRLFDAFSRSHAAKKGLQPAEAADAMPELALKNDKTHDSFSKVLFRNAGSVLGAAVPYILVQRYANRKTGGLDPNKSYEQNLKAVLAAFEIPFAVFTVGIEGWQRGYDKLTGYKPLVEELEVKYRDDKKKPPQREVLSHAAMVDKSRASSSQTLTVSA
jgi:hypothetical protein